MKTIYNIFKHALFFVAMILVSCHKDVEDLVSVESQKVLVELSVSSNDLVTRATPIESEKVINSLRIYAFYNNEQVGYVSRQSTLPGSPFYMDLELPISGVHDVEFFLVANEEVMVNAGTLSEKMSKAELEAINFTGLQSTTSLPMFGKHTESLDVDALSNDINVTLEHESHQILNQKIAFELQRPLAKLSVYAAKATGAATDPQISHVELLSGGTRQFNYLFPQSVTTLNAIPSRANNRTMLASVITVDRVVEKGSSEAQSSANYNEIAIAQYVAEVAVGASAWNVPSSNTNAAVLHVEYALGTGKELKHAYVNLPVIQRNHHIKVCILISAEGQVTVNYEVADWEDNQMQNYHFSYPTHSFLRESIPTTESEIAAKPSRAAMMAENTPFKGYFQMIQPLNDAWTPTLLGLNASNSEIRVYEVDTNIEVNTYPIPASDSWYRIEVWPLTGKMVVNEEVVLGISYTASGLTESEFLLINGSNLEYYWPYNGTSQQDAECVIITMKN